MGGPPLPGEKGMDMQHIIMERLFDSLMHFVFASLFTAYLPERK